MFRINDDKKPLVIIICLVLIVLSVLLIARTSCRKPGGAQQAQIKEMNAIYAEAAARYLGHDKHVVLLTLPASSSPYLKSQIKTFEKVFGENNITIDAVKEVADDGQMALIEMGMPADLFLGVLREYPDEDALVSLIGPPMQTGLDTGRIPEKRPEFIVAVPVAFPPAVRDLMQEGVVDMSIVPREHPQLTGDKKPVTAQEKFAAYYEVVTAHD